MPPLEGDGRLVKHCSATQKGRLAVCRTDKEPGGPRRCPGDARAAYGRAASTVAMLEAEEVSILADLDEPEDSHRVDGSSAPQAYL